MPGDAITELAWWDVCTVADVRLTFAPGRHFSGRSMTNRFSTLWGSFVLEGSKRSISVLTPAIHRRSRNLNALWRFRSGDAGVRGLQRILAGDPHVPEQTAQAART